MGSIQLIEFSWVGLGLLWADVDRAGAELVLSGSGSVVISGLVMVFKGTRMKWRNYNFSNFVSRIERWDILSI